MKMMSIVLLAAVALVATRTRKLRVLPAAPSLSPSPPKGAFAGWCRTLSVELTLDDANTVTAVAVSD